METVYESDRAVLIQGTAEEAIEALPRDAYDLLITDPPYGVNFKSNFRDGNKFDPLIGDDGTYDPVPTLDAALRKLRTSRHAYIFGPFEYPEDFPLGGATELIWDKTQTGLGNLSAPWGPQHERILFGVYVPSKKNREDGYGRGRLSARLRKGSIISVGRPNSRGVKRHPTEKPVELLRQLIESSSVIGETVFDPYAGSGSTGVAALIEGRRTILVELDEQYIPVIASRLEATEKWLDQRLEDNDE